MTRSIIEEIIENLVHLLFKWKKQIARILVIAAIVLLLTFINKLSPNNSAWLQGSWKNQSNSYSFTAKNKNFTDWTVKQKGNVVLKIGRLDVNSSKKRMIVTDDRHTIEYQAFRTGRKQLKLKIVRNGKTENVLKLKKE